MFTRKGTVLALASLLAAGTLAAATSYQVAYVTGTSGPAAGGTAVAIYGAATLWALRGDRNRILTAWIIVAALIYLVMTGVWLPWYLSWIWAPALLRWERGFKMVSVSVFGIAVILTFWYSIPGRF